MGTATYYLTKLKEIAGEGNVGVVGLSYREGVREVVHTMAHALIKVLKFEGYEVFGIDSLFTPEEVLQTGIAWTPSSC